MNEENPVEAPPEDDNELIIPAPKRGAELLANLHTLELDRDYVPPPWASKPTKNYFLEIIKNGVVIGQKDINEKPFYLVGKLADLCDIVLEHPSISRKHAVFQHKNDGTLHLYDIGSTHGVKVNKKNLAPRTFHKLGVGDVIKFGFSTRLFIVGIDGETTAKEGDEKLIASGFAKEGEEPQQSAKSSLKSKYLDLLKRHDHKQGHVQKKTAPSDADGISWGMVDEDEIRAYENEEDIRLDPDLLRELPDLSAKDYEKIDEYEKKLRQYQNLEKELDHILRKEQEDFGLTENDKTRKQNLETKVNEMYSKVQMMEDNLRYALFQEIKEKDRVSRRREADSFEDDEFYDRTIKKVKTDQQTNKKEAAPEGETFESLKKKLEDMISLRQELNEKILALALNPELEANGSKEKEDEMDELDKFMQENDTKVKAESRTQLVDSLKATNEEIQELQRLLKFVRPSYNASAQPVEKKPEERKTQPSGPPPTKPEAKPQPNMLDRLKQLNKKIEPDFAEPESHKPEVQKKPQPQPNQKKVYGVATKPPPRNMRESDYENPEYVDVDWVPPSDKGESI